MYIILCKGRSKGATKGSPMLLLLTSGYIVHHAREGMEYKTLAQGPRGMKGQLG